MQFFRRRETFFFLKKNFFQSSMMEKQTLLKFKYPSSQCDKAPTLSIISQYKCNLCNITSIRTLKIIMPHYLFLQSGINVLMSLLAKDVLPWRRDQQLWTWLNEDITKLIRPQLGLNYYFPFRKTLRKKFNSVVVFIFFQTLLMTRRTVCRVIGGLPIISCNGWLKS